MNPIDIEGKVSNVEKTSDTKVVSVIAKMNDYVYSATKDGDGNFMASRITGFGPIPKEVVWHMICLADGEFETGEAVNGENTSVERKTGVDQAEVAG